MNGSVPKNGRRHGGRPAGTSCTVVASYGRVVHRSFLSQGSPSGMTLLIKTLPENIRR